MTANKTTTKMYLHSYMTRVGEDQWVRFAEFFNVYGDIERISLQGAGRDVVVFTAALDKILKYRHLAYRSVTWEAGDGEEEAFAVLHGLHSVPSQA